MEGCMRDYMIKYFPLTPGADPNLANSSGGTPLMGAAASGQLQLLVII